MLSRPPDRRALYRRRKAAGRCVVLVEVDERVINWLERGDVRALPAGREMHTRQEIGAAISELLKVSSR
jgi:hypothetical protein